MSDGSHLTARRPPEGVRHHLLVDDVGGAPRAGLRPHGDHGQMTIGDAVTDTAAALGRRWAAARAEDAGPTARLAALVADPEGLELAVRFVDRVMRPEDPAVAARELAALRDLRGAARRVLGMPADCRAPTGPGRSDRAP